MDIIEIIGKEIDDFAKQAAHFYNKGFEIGLKETEPERYCRFHSQQPIVESVDRFYYLGIEHGAAWRKLRAELARTKRIE